MKKHNNIDRHPINTTISTLYLGNYMNFPRHNIEQTSYTISFFHQHIFMLKLSSAMEVKNTETAFSNKTVNLNILFFSEHTIYL